MLEILDRCNLVGINDAFLPCNQYHLASFCFCRSLQDKAQLFLAKKLSNYDGDPNKIFAKLECPELHQEIFSIAAGILHDKDMKDVVLNEAWTGFILYFHQYKNLKNLSNLETRENDFAELFLSSKKCFEEGKLDHAICLSFQLVALQDSGMVMSTLLLNRSAALLMMENYYDAALSSISSMIIANKLLPKALYRLIKSLKCFDFNKHAGVLSIMSADAFPEESSLQQQFQEILDDDCR